MTNKEAIKALKYLVGHAKKEGLNHVDCVSVEALDLAINAIEERPQGEWIFNKLTGDTICSRCRRTRRDTRKEHIYFCNHCGTRMITASEVDNDNQL